MRVGINCRSIMPVQQAQSNLRRRLAIGVVETDLVAEAPNFQRRLIENDTHGIQSGADTSTREEPGSTDLGNRDYFREEIPGATHEKRKSVNSGKIVAMRPSMGPAPKLTSFTQKSPSNSPGFVLVTRLRMGSLCICA